MSVPSAQARTTLLLRSAESSGDETLGRLVPLLHQELKRVARRQLAREGSRQTLQTTDLVHEAYLRLVDQTQGTEHGRAYFFAAAARAMRQVLIGRARRRCAAKRGGGQAAVDLDEGRIALDKGSIAVDAFADALVDLDAALEELTKLSPRQARVVECRYFGGTSVEDMAEALAISPRTVKYDWALARAWLYGAPRGAAGAGG
jgi:RNA polymerase sigma factor (TIGR02999 family)